MRVREYSAQTNNDVVKVTCGHDLVNLPDIAGSYITCTYDNQWWLAYVPIVLLESDDANVSFLHPENRIDGESRSRDEDEHR